MKTLRIAINCCLVVLSLTGCATYSQGPKTQPGKVAWLNELLGFLIGSAEISVYSAASANSERQSH